MNNVILIGRQTRDGEFIERETNSVYKFTIAVDREFKKDGGPTADFPRVVVFGKQAENCNKYLGKGKLVGVEGRIQTGSYKNEEGKTVYTTDVIADRVEFLSPKNDTTTQEAPEDDFARLNDEIPF